ncbi:GroES-like protein [Coniophora puteana RWD-64-598 SS2]|uniref:GroES-like protein n=1 Tax=Coniophora puteana (strain RWD-64-598) TaxID=741705 RepID=A0A5M3MFC6_CONPW|nr:GroES-like protein [Coniophora puteana RWD-64-598 SS2]EIW77948.1 GroES-like protein [Coniophora puteana RWD-64-598 SS2]
MPKDDDHWHLAGTQTALLLPGVGASFALQQISIPQAGPGEVLVKNYAAGLNPIDYKTQESGFYVVREYPAILGFEGAGVVSAIGEGVIHLKEGDRVAYQGVATNKGRSFQQWVVTSADWVFKLPNSISFDTAAAIPIALLAAVIGTYQPPPHGLGVATPWSSTGRSAHSGSPIVVLGGTSNVGQYAIQLARLAGFDAIITTASPRNSSLLQRLGATHVLDRSLSIEALVQEVEKITGNKKVLHVFDAVGIAETQQAALSIVAEGGKVLTTNAPQGKAPEGSDKQVVFVMGALMVPQHQAFGKEFLSVWASLFESGDIKASAVEIVPGGLNGVETTLKQLKTISGKKFVVRPFETDV